MSWDLDTARKRLGIEGGEQDEVIESAMNFALAVAESYCDRRFLKQEDRQEFTLPCGPNLLVRRYPLVSLETIEPIDPQPDPPPEPYDVSAAWRMDKKRGIVFVVGAPPWVAGGVDAAAPSPFYGRESAGFVLNYTGGYDPLPADLEQALWLVFDAVWFATPGWGADAGSQAGAGAGGAVKSFNIDGMALAFDTGSGDKAASQAGGDVGSFGPFLPLSATSLLHPYRAETVIGIG
ncbi:Phage QLRG family, putative DNA packaging [Variovorax sp. HW608]|uniref:phage gp6-like head-tail connector protein n=1 Tax=Variovorax sp. HW608 TaxID=1034889 RepID=UPI00081FCFB0|nr:phage gp6-like head-tail connector protein [Variovorax sp. HW608]SCK49057.1 Phage QLRG family, putative DNA packaging [Variovorax sp. HW608]